MEKCSPLSLDLTRGPSVHIEEPKILATCLPGAHNDTAASYRQLGESIS
jgi:hypothetical protein